MVANWNRTSGRRGFPIWRKGQNADLEAPSWLWASVVELLALHEAAYLEHCRRFALTEAA
jgi:uncharacterized protein (DUF2252 family)